MARTTGARNTDYQEKRQKMAAEAANTLLHSAAQRPSLREFARTMNVSVNNLRHYFGDRDGLIEAAMETMLSRGAPHIERMLSRAELPLKEAVHNTLHELVTGWEPFLSNLHVSGLSEGLVSERLGPAYVNFLLEPTLQPFERLFQTYIDRGQLRSTSTRTMALVLLSPVILALLHQGALGGSACRPLDLHAFLDEHIDGFLRGYQP